MDGVTEQELLGVAAAIERGSEHIIARAILTAAENQGIEIAPVTGFTTHPGRGASGQLHGEQILVGSRTFLLDHAIDVPAEPDTAENTDDGAGQAAETSVLVARGGVLLGRIGLRDTIKRDARTAVAALHAQGLKTVLLTGDTPAAAASVAARLGIDTVLAGVLPAEKADAIRSLQENGARVAMVGDGINDAVALAAADLGLAMVSGSDIALKSADIILVRDDLAVIPDAIGLSRRTLRTIKTNLGWAFGYNIAAIPIAAAGLLNPLIAAGAMALSSVLVVYNSLRLQNFRRTPRR